MQGPPQKSNLHNHQENREEETAADDAEFGDACLPRADQPRLQAVERFPSHINNPAACFASCSHIVEDV